LAAIAEIGVSPRRALGATPPSPADHEFDFLLACCRRELGYQAACDTSAPIDLERLFRLADHHRVFPALNAASHAGDIPSNSRDQMRVRLHKHGRNTLRLSSELVSILRKLRDHEIPAMPHKGAALAQFLFGDPGMRQFGDLDFLIHAKDVHRAKTALADLRYKQNLMLSARQEKEYLRVGNECVFGCEQGDNLVELQWQILPHFYSVAFDMEALFSRSIPIELESEAVRVLGKEDLMLVLCVHAAKHGWEHLGMVRDIARLAQMAPDWHWVMTEAKRLGILRILTVTLLLARNLLGCELPAALRPDRLSDQLARRFELRLRTEQYNYPESANYFCMMISLRERRRDQLRFVWRLLTTPSVSEWKSAQLPDQLFSFYRGIRVARLFTRVALEVRPSSAKLSPLV
jgi:Uncharacterised nucleotidyltransferase